MVRIEGVEMSSEAIKEMFSKLPTRSSITVFNHERSFGIVVGFAEQGFGWGAITLVVDKTTGEARCDLEEMSPDKCGEILMRAVGSAVLGPNDTEPEDK
jgi:hypothetical protein